jgi:AcrR family transcriptional regulator
LSAECSPGLVRTSSQAQEKILRQPTSTESAPKKRVVGRTRRRYVPAEREALIAREAACFFAEQGFGGQTRQLAARLGITQPLLYRYFPSKEALIERVYQDVFVNRWDSAWEKLIADRGQPLQSRLVKFYQEYAHTILTYEWVRLFMLAGFRDLDLNERYLSFLKARLFKKLVQELRQEFNQPNIRKLPVSPMEIEMVWGLHARIFYLGVRQFIYDMPVKIDINRVIEADVISFISGMQHLAVDAN